MQKQNITSVLVVFTSSILDPPTNSSQTTGMRLSLNTTCQLKALLDTLSLTDDAIREQEDRRDLEIAAMIIVVRILYRQSCEWVCFINCTMSCITIIHTEFVA